MGETPRQELERQAHHNPIVYQFLSCYWHGEFTYIEALERIAVSLARVNDEQREQLIAVLERSMVPAGVGGIGGG